MGNVISQLEQQEQRTLRKHPRPDLDRVPEYDKDQAYRIASWTNDGAKLKRRRKRWKAMGIYDEAADRFMVSSALLADPRDPPGTTWQATELLGQGSFGTVGLWDKFDHRGNIVQSLAIKQTRNREPRPHVDMADRRPGYDNIPSEAFWTDMLGRETPYIPALHGLKVFQGYDSRDVIWRFYSEYCQHGDLMALIQLYREFNRKHPHKEEQVIPELFAWYVLYGLAHALDKQDLSENCLHRVGRELKHDVTKGKKFILHLDIKDANILLGKPYPDPQFSKYPIPKLGDLGLATLTSRKHGPNSRAFKHWGTMCWFPPEQYQQGHLDDNWQIPLVHPRGDTNYPFDQRHGVWQVGAVCFCLLLLVSNNKWLEKVIRDLADDRHAEHRVRHNDGYILDGRFREESFNNYSTDLIHTLNSCLNLIPEKRPFPDQLLAICREGIEKEVQRLGRKRMAVPPVFSGRNGWAELEDHVRSQPQPAKPPKHKRRYSAEAAKPARASKLRKLSNIFFWG